jgi:hypothetical protein
LVEGRLACVSRYIQRHKPGRQRFCSLKCAERLQSTAKELYLVTDGDLKKLGCLTRANPQHKDWAPLKLYMQSQARARADTPPAALAGLQTCPRAQHSTAELYGAERVQQALRQRVTRERRARQVEQAAHAKHGGADGLERARLQRIDDRTEARKRKRAARESKARPCTAACAMRLRPCRALATPGASTLSGRGSMQMPH